MNKNKIVGIFETKKYNYNDFIIDRFQINITNLKMNIYNIP